jgi:hypothetical protein
MKKLLVTLLLVAASATAAHAALKVIGKGSTMNFDTSSFPPAMKAKYEIFRVKCVKCHTLERTIVAIQTGVAPISGQPFDRDAARAYGAKMTRKTDSGMSKADVKTCTEVMEYLVDHAEHR